MTGAQRRVRAMAKVFVFPGQGSQFIGMGKPLAEAFPVANHVFEEVDDALEQRLTRLMFDGAESDLRLTENAQPALMAVSLAIVRVVQKEGNIDLIDKVAFMAGHSLGEYSALCAAGTFELAQTARLLKTRGRAMQAAVPVGAGAMVALLGVDLPEAEELAGEAAGDEICTVANDNAPGQVVLGGHADAVERAIALAEKMRKRTVRLKVSAPFHCSLMQPAADAMEAALAQEILDPPDVPIITNVTAAPEDDPERIRELLVEQVTSRVRWRESVAGFTALDVDTIYEVGAGKVLAGLTRRIDRELRAVAVNTPKDIEKLLAEL